MALGISAFLMTCRKKFGQVCRVSEQGKSAGLLQQLVAG